MLTNVDEATVVLYPLHCPALGVLLLVLLGYLCGLSTHLSCSGKGAMHLACKNMNQLLRFATSCLLHSFLRSIAEGRGTHPF